MSPGVMPQAAGGQGDRSTDLSDLRMVGSMHERKVLLMAELADGFMGPCPAAWAPSRNCSRSGPDRSSATTASPAALLNVGGFYDKLTGFLDEVVERVDSRKPIHRSMLIVERSLPR